MLYFVQVVNHTKTASYQNDKPTVILPLPDLPYDDAQFEES